MTAIEAMRHLQSVAANFAGHAPESGRCKTSSRSLFAGKETAEDGEHHENHDSDNHAAEK